MPLFNKGSIFSSENVLETEIKKELESIIGEVGASTMADIGKVMGKAMASLKGKADGSLISKLVKEKAKQYKLPYNCKKNFLSAIFSHAKMLYKLGLN